MLPNLFHNQKVNDDSFWNNNLFKEIYQLAEDFNRNINESYHYYQSNYLTANLQNNNNIDNCLILFIIYQFTGL